MNTTLDTMSIRALESLRHTATIVDLAPNESLQASDDESGSWYRVIDGAVREVSRLTSGRRDIVAFVLPGEVLGGSIAGANAHVAECIAASRLEKYPLSECMRLARADAIVARFMDQLAGVEKERMRERTLLLAHASVPSKVGGFLLQMLARAGEHEEGEGVVELPMSRSDIADHLRISMETVCRALSSLRAQRLIVTEGTRRIRLIDPLRLARFSRVDSATLPVSPTDGVRHICLTLAANASRR